MNCNVEIHDGLKESGDILCPFCNEKLQDYLVKEQDVCCDKQEIINDNGHVCKNCGQVNGYDAADEYVDFYNNMYLIRRKSIYHRKYHLYNKVDFLSSKNGFQISFKDKDKTIRIFNEVDKIPSQINGDRKRMINLDFVLKQLFKMLGLPYDKIQISNSKKTLTFYQEYFDNILLLVGDKIKSIVGTP